MTRSKLPLLVVKVYHFLSIKGAAPTGFVTPIPKRAPTNFVFTLRRAWARGGFNQNGWGTKPQTARQGGGRPSAEGKALCSGPSAASGKKKKKKDRGDLIFEILFLAGGRPWPPKACPAPTKSAE